MVSSFRCRISSSLRAFGLFRLQRACGIARGRRGRILHDIRRSVTERHVAPIAQLLIGPKRLPCLQLAFDDGSSRIPICLGMATTTGSWPDSTP